MAKAPMNPGDLSGLANKDWLPTYSDFEPPARPKPRPNPNNYISNRERTRGDSQVIDWSGGKSLQISPDDYISPAERGGKRGR